MKNYNKNMIGFAATSLLYISGLPSAYSQTLSLIPLAQEAEHPFVKDGFCWIAGVDRSAQGAAIYLTQRQEIYVTPSNGKPAPKLDMLDLNISKSKVTGGMTVECEKARFEYASENDEYGVITAYYGDNGSLYFEPKGNCWQLTSSNIFKRPAGDRHVN
ncbi:hypothetical protein LPB140_07685 [Sphingorhabdus lutea]|uniref:Uncharacterized protein n=1 Tax=Sphingorhabdus lutea TaxID=1913578 RepID=A0A1L3JC37_9SPHN|nr:hypothetical protein [Sphingorhabdus lutea]APG62691.1 hypothetical protein LPB140_07685 [Sphingorhabdus lutea]